jgi:hypothetical protein
MSDNLKNRKNISRGRPVVPPKHPPHFNRLEEPSIQSAAPAIPTTEKSKAPGNISFSLFAEEGSVQAAVAA